MLIFKNRREASRGECSAFSPFPVILQAQGVSMKNIILIGDVIQKLKEIPDESVNTCVTSPPYWGLRDYGVPGQIGLEKTPEEYVDKMVQVFREVRRVLRDDGTLWLNLGDSYATNHYSDSHTYDRKYNGRNRDNGYPNKGTPGLRTKNLIGIPWRVAFALQADGWYLRQDIIWHKPNPMPESVKDRCTKAHEYIFLLSKSQKYYYDYEAIKEEGKGYGRSENFRDDKYKNNNSFNNSAIIEGSKGGGRSLIDGSGRNKRSVWTVSTKPFSGAHFATFPPDLIEPCILAGSPRDGIVLDCFGGAGTTAVTSLKNGRKYIIIELNPEYAEMAGNRIKYGTVDAEIIESEKKQGILF